MGCSAHHFMEAWSEAMHHGPCSFCLQSSAQTGHQDTLNMSRLSIISRSHVTVAAVLRCCLLMKNTFVFLLYRRLLLVSDLLVHRYVFHVSAVWMCVGDESITMFVCVCFVIVHLSLTAWLLLRSLHILDPSAPWEVCRRPKIDAGSFCLRQTTNRYSSGPPPQK